MSIGDYEDHLPAQDVRVPEVGDPVHYFDAQEDLPYAAIVTGTVPMSLDCDLVVFRPMSIEFPQTVPHESTAGEWHRWEWRTD
jgi:hypothetical protein